MVKIEDGARIQKLVHESMNRLKNCSESDESDARVHESYSQIFDSFDSRFIRKIRKIRVQITPLPSNALQHPQNIAHQSNSLGILVFRCRIQRWHLGNDRCLLPRPQS